MKILATLLALAVAVAVSADIHAFGMRDAIPRDCVALAFFLVVRSMVNRGLKTSK